ncbi:MAG: hypothetical protein ACXVJF_00005 [Acidimicrobiia bacterium]
MPAAVREQRDVDAPGRHEDRPLLVVSLVLVVLPFVVALVSVVASHWHPSGDQAIEVLRIRDVGTSHTPLVGPWSRWGWSHPGPAMFWLLAPFLRVLGNDGVLIGTVLCGIGSAVGIVLIAYRVGRGPGAAITAGFLAALASAAGFELMVDPWNPWIAFFPFALFLAAVVGTTATDPRLLVVAVLVGSFVVQTHAGYLALVGGLLAVAAVVCWRTDRRAFLVAAGLGVVVWIPAVVDQIVHDPGNLRQLLDYARSGSEPTAGWANAFGAMSSQLRPLGPWIANHETHFGFERTATGAWSIAVIALVAGLGLLAHRRGGKIAARLALVTLVAIALAFVSSSRITGAFVGYVVAYWRPVAAMTWLSIVCSVLSIVRRRTVERAVVAVGLGVLVVTSVLAIGAAPASVPLEQVSNAIGHVGPPTRRALDPDRRYLVQGGDVQTLNAPASGMLLYLAEHGFDVVAPTGPEAELQFGAWRIGEASDVDAVVAMTSAPAHDPRWRPPAGGRVVARWDPLTPAQRRSARRLERRIRHALGQRAPEFLFLDDADTRDRVVADGADRRDVDAHARLQAAGEAYVVVVAPVRSRPPA